MESGRVDSREVCGCFAADGCVKACHTKPRRSTLSVNFPGCFLNTESASLPGQRHSQNVTATHAHRPRAHTHTRRRCARLYGSFVFMLPYVFRLHGFFVLSKLNTQAIIHDARREACSATGRLLVGQRRWQVARLLQGRWRVQPQQIFSDSG